MDNEDFYIDDEEIGALTWGGGGGGDTADDDHSETYSDSDNGQLFSSSCSDDRGPMPISLDLSCTDAGEAMIISVSLPWGGAGGGGDSRW